MMLIGIPKITSVFLLLPLFFFFLFLLIVLFIGSHRIDDGEDLIASIMHGHITVQVVKIRPPVDVVHWK